jgi:hypothetical protein
MKRYLIAIIIISMLFSGLLPGCDSKQTEIDTLRNEIEQLKEQDKAKILKQAEAYYAIVKLLPAKSSGEFKIVTGDEMTEAIAEQIKASGKLWSLIKATEDPVLISECQPEGWLNQIPRSSSYIRSYAESKYRELMSKYYSQQYIDEQLSMLGQITEKTVADVITPKTPKPEVEEIIPKPKLDITVVIEYEGKCVYQVTSSTSWGSFWRTGSGNTNRVYENIQLPFHCRAEKYKEGDGTLVLQLLYNGEVVAQDTAIVGDDEAWVYWLGPK